MRARLGHGDAPAVTVVVPFRDTAPSFVQEAVESVLAQTFGAWELLLVDDDAPPDTAAAVRQAASGAAAAVRYLRHPGGTHEGLSASRNLGIREARGRYVAFLDADDVWLPSKLEEQTALMEEFPDAGMLYGNAIYWFGWTGRGEDRERDFRPELGVSTERALPPPGPLAAYLRGGAAVPCTNSVLARRRVVLQVGAFEESFTGLYEDQVFYAKMCLAAPVVAVDRCWDRYRQHPDSLSARAGPTERREARARYLSWLEDYAADRGMLNPELRNAIERELRHLRHPLLARAFRVGGKALRRIFPGGDP